MTFSQSERDNVSHTYNVAGPFGVVPHAPFLAEEIERLGHDDFRLIGILIAPSSVATFCTRLSTGRTKITIALWRPSAS